MCWWLCLMELKYIHMLERISFVFLLLMCAPSTIVNFSLCSAAAVNKEACGTNGVCYCDNIRPQYFGVYCEKCGLHNIPTNIPTNTSFLDLNRNEIQSMPENSLWGLYHLSDLQLDMNKLTELPGNIFRDLQALEYLNIKWNKLQVLPEGLLAKTPILSCLYLDDNNIQVLPGNLFSSTPLLEQFSVSKNNLTSLPVNIFSATPLLRNVNIEMNNVREIPAHLFDETTRLAYIYAADNAIPKIPKHLLAFTSNFKDIDLPGNGLLDLPDDIFSSAPAVYSVDLSSNLIPLVTNRTWHGVNIIYNLYLSRNKLSNIPQDFFRDVYIDTVLDLSNNVIEEIPAGLFNMNKRPHELRWLYLHGNSLIYLDKDSFTGLMNVSVITLSSNNIHSIDQQVFRGKQLDQIFLFGNKLTRIEENSFEGPSISEVHLYGNELESISEEFLLGLKNTTVIFLQCDSLRRLPRDSNYQLIKCVSPLSLPAIDISRYQGPAKESFLLGGFSCHNERCVPCLQGTYGNRVTNGCQTCPKGGFYQDQIGQLTSTFGGFGCKKCNNGTFVPHGGGTSAKACEVCPGGTNKSEHAGFRGCFCKENYARTNRYGPCTICEDDGLNCSQEFKSLLPGYYWNWNFPNANISDYKKFITNLQVDAAVLINNYTSYMGKFPQIFKCPREKSCSNSNGYIEGQCAYGYTGWLCTTCLPGYYSVLNSCIRCPRKEILMLEVGLFLSISVGACLLLVRQLKRNTNTDEKRRTVLNLIISRVKLLLGFYQVVGEIFSSLHEINWTGPLVMIGTFISSLELNVLKMFVRPRCFSENLVINPKTEFIIGVSCPAVIILIPLFIYSLKKFYLYSKYLLYNTPFSQSSLGGLRTQLFTCTFVLQFLFYPPICSIVFQMYPGACKTFYLDESKNYSTTRLRSDYDIVCKDLSMYHICAYIFTGVYVVAFPVILLYLLWKYVSRHRYSCNMRQRRSCSIQEDEIMNNDERISLVGNNSDECPCSVPMWFKFLCENYKQKYWFWEIIELSRKVTQTLLITLYGWEDRLTVLVTTCLSVLFLLLHAWHIPMKSSYEQRLQMFSLTVIFVNVLVGANQDVLQDEHEDSFTAILILLNIVVLLIIAGELIIAMVMYMKNISKTLSVISFSKRLKKN